MINESDSVHSLFSECLTHHRSPQIRVQNGNKLLMIEELEVEKNSLLKPLKDIESFILVFFGVVCIMNSHDDKTGWRDLC